MPRTLILSATAFLLVAAEASGQYPGLRIWAPYGAGFDYVPRRAIGGIYWSGDVLGDVWRRVPLFPMGVVERPIVIRPLIPAPAFPGPVTPKYDLSGIDLDVESPAKLFGTPPGPVAALPMPKKAAAVPERAPPPAPAPALAAKTPPEDDRQTPRATAVEESKRMVELGLQAFRDREYGLAVRRFQQATALDANHTRAHFLLGQAYLAVGQLRDAAQAIFDGLALDPNWPTSAFQPRVELYAKAPEDWHEHNRRLADATVRQPKVSEYRFLRGYLAWFDGDRPQAMDWFNHARPLTPEPRWIDLFLKNAAARPVALR